MLMVYVPMVLLSSLHVHPAQELSELVDCTKCETLVHHQGHFTTSPQQQGECLSCRFLTTQLLVSCEQVQSVEVQCVGQAECQPAAQPVRSVPVHHHLRAPPVVL